MDTLGRRIKGTSRILWHNEIGGHHVVVREYEKYIPTLTGTGQRERKIDQEILVDGKPLESLCTYRLHKIFDEDDCIEPGD